MEEWVLYPVLISLLWYCLIT